jgi:hypothetical protein
MLDGNNDSFIDELNELTDLLCSSKKLDGDVDSNVRIRI